MLNLKTIFKKKSAPEDASMSAASDMPSESSGKKLLKHGTGAVALISVIAIAKKYGPQVIDKIKEKVNEKSNKGKT